MPITFSEQFNISKEVLEITGVFDVILDIDTRVFIDPALLELCTEPEFLDARKKVEKYFSDIITLLRHSNMNQRRSYFFMVLPIHIVTRITLILQKKETTGEVLSILNYRGEQLIKPLSKQN